MSDLFFNGCESWMSEEEVDNKDDNPLDVHQATGEEIATAEEQVEHVLTVEAEAESAADSVAKIDAEMRQCNRIFEKYAELDRMIAYIKNYGIDQGFLFLCNRNNILGQSFGIKFAALESYDLKGNPNSPEAIAALEGLGTAVKTVWEFIKRTIARLLDWIDRILSFRDLRVKMYKHSIESLKKRVKNIKNWSVPASEDVIADPATVTRLIEKLKQLSVREDAENTQTAKDLKMSQEIDKIESERDSWANGVVANELAHQHCSLVEVNHILDNASEALAGLDKCFNSLPQLRKTLSEIRIDASKNGGDANAIKEKIDNAKLAIRRANRRIDSFLDICGQSIKNARTCIKLAEENNKAGTESFSIEDIPGTEGISFRDGLMQSFTAIRRAMQAANQDAKGYLSPLAEVKSKITKLRALPDKEMTGYTLQSLANWIRLNPAKLLVQLDTEIKKLPGYKTKDKWAGEGDKVAEQLENMIKKLEATEPSKVSLNLKQMKPADLVKLVDYCINSCKAIQHLNETYWGGNDLTLNGAAIGPNVVRIMRRCHRNMNFITDTELSIVKSVLNMADAAAKS